MTARLSIATLSWILLASAAPHAIDTKASTLTIHVGKTGAFSAFGHEHVIAAPIASGTADTAAKSVELRVDAAALRVRDPKGSDSDKEQIQKTMLGPEVLDAERFHEITFKSTSAHDNGSGAWTDASALRTFTRASTSFSLALSGSEKCRDL